jgi:hypothetical protein
MAFALTTVALVGAGVAAAGGLAKLGVSLAGRRDRINEQKAAKEEMRKMKKEYENLDTSNLAAGVRNPFENLENTFEDLTVNQQQAQFQAQQFQQTQANIMDTLSSAAGGSGIAGLAQSLANQGIISAQKSSASIGMQESQNQKLAAQQAAKNQQLEGQGEMYAEKMRQQGAETARGLEYQKTSTLFGMSQQRAAAANAARQQAKADQMSAIGDIASAGSQIATAGMKIPKLPGGGTPLQQGVTTATGSLTKAAENFYQGDTKTYEMDYAQLGGLKDEIQYDPNQISVGGGGSVPSYLSPFQFKINKNK